MKNQHHSADDSPTMTSQGDRWLVHLVDRAIDGYGPVKSVSVATQQVLAKADGDVEVAERTLARQHYLMAAGEGFVTGLGGFAMLPLSMPANIAGYYAVAARQAGAVAHLRGYDLESPAVRTAIAVCLVGEDVSEVLGKVGLGTSGLTSKIVGGMLPASLSAALHKAIAFRLIVVVGAKKFANLGRLVPVVGGVVSAGADAWLLRGVGRAAREIFPEKQV